MGGRRRGPASVSKGTLPPLQRQLRLPACRDRGPTLASRMLVSTRATPWFSRKSWILLTLLNSESTVVRLVFRSMTWLMPWRGPTRSVVAGCFSSCTGQAPERGRAPRLWRQPAPHSASPVGSPARPAKSLRTKVQAAHSAGAYYASHTSGAVQEGTNQTWSLGPALQLGQLQLLGLTSPARSLTCQQHSRASLGARRAPHVSQATV